MAVPTQMNELLQKRMDRKDFLKHVGLGVAVLTGVAGVLKMFRPQEQGAGYGASAYGGSPTLRSQK
jgi:predicted secreted protein